MNAKECRGVFNLMIKGLATKGVGPDAADPAQLMVTIQMHTLQAMWEIAAQLAELNATRKSLVQ